MICKLFGVKRGTFTNDAGQEVRFGHLFVVHDFDDLDSADCSGQEVEKVKFDYDSASELIDCGLKYPIDVDLQFNSKGKCVHVVLGQPVQGKSTTEQIAAVEDLKKQAFSAK